MSGRHHIYAPEKSASGSPMFDSAAQMGRRRPTVLRQQGEETEGQHSGGF
jgi:hypothetical protein